MPKLMNQTDSVVLKTVSNFGFTAQRVDTLTSSEYTIVGIAIDVSPSVSPFKADLEKAYRDIVGACRKNPRSENLLIRAATFNENLGELHGFGALDTIDEAKVALNTNGGGTALWDATMEGVEAIDTYGKQLDAMDYAINALLVVATDGEENSSKTANTAKIKARIAQVRKDEVLESLKVIVIGIGTDPKTSQYLDNYTKEIGADQFVSISETDAKSFAKLADFVSRSISSSSQSLGTKGQSANLTI